MSNVIGCWVGAVVALSFPMRRVAGSSPALSICSSTILPGDILLYLAALILIFCFYWSTAVEVVHFLFGWGIFVRHGNDGQKAQLSSSAAECYFGHG